MDELLAAFRAADPILVNALTFLIGIYAGNRITIAQERRREFNDAARPMRLLLVEAKDALTPYAARPSSTQIHLIESKLGPLRRYRFRKALRRYEDASRKTKQDDWGQAFYEEPAAVAKTIDHLLRLLKER